VLTLTLALVNCECDRAHTTAVYFMGAKPRADVEVYELNASDMDAHTSYARR
jgi:hypothetical protein